MFDYKACPLCMGLYTFGSDKLDLVNIQNLTSSQLALAQLINDRLILVSICYKLEFTKQKGFKMTAYLFYHNERLLFL